MGKTDDNDKGALLTNAIHTLVSGQCSDEVESGRLYTQWRRQMGEKLKNGVIMSSSQMGRLSITLELAFPFPTSITFAVFTESSDPLHVLLQDT